MAKDSTYIVLFRGVGGKTQLPVAKLRTALAEAGFAKVATYINSGNALVTSSWSRDKVIETVAEVCAREFDFRKEVYAVTTEEWQAMIDANPFPEATAIGKQLHMAVLAGTPKPEALETIRSYAVEGERIEVVGRAAYLHTPHGFGTSKFAEQFDKRIGVPNTARNWNTVLKLREMAEAL